tara:strand:+ start:860 stop:1180 length:321 start_codon:yes stop_codon:yes gene_type:complete
MNRRGSTDSDSTVFSNVFVKLRGLESVNSRKSLAFLDEMLANEFKAHKNLSPKVFKQMVKQKGICLVNGEEYGNALRKILYRDPKLIAPLKEVKKFKYVKMCLINL